MLNALSEAGEISSSLELAKSLDVQHDEIVGTLNCLVSENYIVLVVKEITGWALLKEGADNAENGTPEYRVTCAIPEEGRQAVEGMVSFSVTFSLPLSGISKPELEKLFEESVTKFGLQNAIKKKWVKMADGLLKRLVDASTLRDDDAELLR